MSVFVCLVRTDGVPVPGALCRRYSTKREVPRVVPPSWCVMGDFAVMLGSDVPGLEAHIARHGEWIGAGVVRLDERPEIPSRGAAHGDGATDLALVLKVLQECGAAGVSKLVGDFAFVAWNHDKRQLIAARDTFGVRRLYMARRGDLLTFSTRASLLTRTESYNLEYFAEYLLHGDDPSERTAFKEVEAVRSAEVVTWERGTLRRVRYWEPPEEGSVVAKRGPEIVEEFRSLLFDAVRSRLTCEANVWSHLTGGMDSSSVVGVAQTMAGRGEIAHGISGVVTYQSDPPLGGDVDHARMVAERYGLRHEVLDGWRVWDDDGSSPPLLDQPAYEQANYAIERRMAKVVAESGGQVLLTGVGGDLYLRPQFERAADLMAQGRIAESAKLVSQWAVATRQSFWKLFAQYAVYPLLPASARYTWGNAALRVPDWISHDFADRYALRDRAGATRYYSAGRGMKSRSIVTEALFTHAGRVGHERLGEVNLEWRHPFFHRPLIEYGLRLPEEWRVAPGADLSKRVLREAMGGMLPEPVRMRRGKGGMQPDLHNALVREATRFGRVAAKPILGELGCLSLRRFAQAIALPAHTDQGKEHQISTALTLELWLRGRSHWWP